MHAGESPANSAGTPPAFQHNSNRIRIAPAKLEPYPQQKRERKYNLFTRPHDLRPFDHLTFDHSTIRPTDCARVSRNYIEKTTMGASKRFDPNLQGPHFGGTLPSGSLPSPHSPPLVQHFRSVTEFLTAFTAYAVAHLPLSPSDIPDGHTLGATFHLSSTALAGLPVNLWRSMEWGEYEHRRATAAVSPL